MSGGGSKKVVAWLLIILLGLPALFVLFEFVVPRFLPANF